MPSISSSARQKIDPAKYVPVATAPAPSIAQNAPPPSAISRSPVMLASLPGLGSGPDAVLRQFNGGGNAPKSRLLVP
jgi:hypothetical protein